MGLMLISLSYPLPRPFRFLLKMDIHLVLLAVAGSVFADCVCQCGVHCARSKRSVCFADHAACIVVMYVRNAAVNVAPSANDFRLGHLSSSCLAGHPGQLPAKAH